MPQRVLQAYMEMLPVIQAQESLRLYEAVTLGTGSFGKKGAAQARANFRALQRTAKKHNPTAVTRPRNPQELAARLAAMGVPVIRVPKKRRPADG